MTTKSTVLLTSLIFISAISSGQVKRTIIPALNPGEQYIFRNTAISDIHEDAVRTINQNFSTSWFLRVIGKTPEGKLMLKATYLKLNQRTEHLFTHDLTGFNSDDFKEFVMKSATDEIRVQNERLRKMGVKTVMVTGDNHLTAKYIAEKAGVDDFIAEARPDDKI